MANSNINISHFSFLNAFSTKFRSFTPFDKKIHIILQSVKFSNKIIINIITIGCFFLWDERLMLVENWNDYKNIFYNLSSLFAWSEVMALLINRGSMTVQCQLHHTGKNGLWVLFHGNVDTLGGWVGQSNTNRFLLFSMV